MSLPSPPCCSLLSSFLFVPPCYCSSSWVLLGRQDTLHDSSWCSMAKDSSLPPICFHTCLLVCSQLVSLFLYLHCDSILLSGCFRSKESPCLPFLTSLSIAQCSSFWWLWGQDSSPICFSYSSLYFTLTCGCSLWVLPGPTVCSLSSVCLRACPPCSLQLVPLLLSLSLAVLLSRCLFGHMILSGSSLALPCSLQRVSFKKIPSSLLLLLGKERISWPLVFLLNFSSFVPVTFPYPRSLPHVTLLTFLLVSNLSPYSLSTTVLLSRSPFGRERIVFLLFPFFPSLSLWSFQRFLHFSPHSCCSRCWDPKIPLVSHMCSHLCPYSASFFLLAVGSRL